MLTLLSEGKRLEKVKQTRLSRHQSLHFPSYSDVFLDGRLWLHRFNVCKFSLKKQRVHIPQRQACPTIRHLEIYNGFPPLAYMSPPNCLFRSSALPVRVYWSYPAGKQFLAPPLSSTASRVRPISPQLFLFLSLIFFSHSSQDEKYFNRDFFLLYLLLLLMGLFRTSYFHNQTVLLFAIKK